MLRRSRASAIRGLSFDHVALGKKGPTLALEVPPGSTLAIIGVAGSGKSRLIEAIAGREKIERGEIARPQRVSYLELPEWSRRETPLSIVREILGKTSPQAATDILTALGIWEVRQKACHNLTSGQQVAASFLQVLLRPAELVCVDGFLDQVDLLTFEQIWSSLQAARREGAILAYVTNQPEIAERADFVLVLRGEQFVFSGTPDALRRTTVETEIEVRTENRAGVKALVDPFEVAIRDSPEGLRLSAKEGQAIAAKLLQEGYGDVNFIVVRQPTFREALSRIM